MSHFFKVPFRVSGFFTSKKKSTSQNHQEGPLHIHGPAPAVRVPMNSSALFNDLRR
jgi:hypothetical protein